MLRTSTLQKKAGSSPNQPNLFYLEESPFYLKPQLLDSKSLKALESVKEIALDQFRRIDRALSKMDSPRYLGIKWFYIRQDYAQLSKRPTESAISDLKKFISESKENYPGDSHVLSRSLDVIGIMFELENQIKMSGSSAYEKRFRAMQKQNEKSPQFYAASLLSIFKEF